MKIIILTLIVLLVVITPAFAEQVIFSEGKEYEIAEITAEYSLNKHSNIFKTQGYTTTGEMFFLRVYSTFEKVMLLDRDGNWQKAKMKEKIIEKLEPVVAEKEGINLHILLDQHERVYTKSEYKLFVKTFDESLYSGNNFQNFDGKISGAKVSSIIIDPEGEIKGEFEGFVENGLYERSILVEENLWQRGWYDVNVLIEFDGKSYFEQLSFYVFGTPPPSDGSSSCPEGQTKVNGVCV